jgi:ParB family chromosome partitioning protein
MADLQIEYRELDSLIPYARNAKRHDPDNVRFLAGLIAEYGYTNPCLVDSKGIVAGHGRVLAVSLLNSQGKAISLPNGGNLPANAIPCVDCTGWTDTQRRAYIIADNRSVERSPWDNEMLALELGDLAALDFDIELTGFSLGDLELMVGGQGEPGGDGSRETSTKEIDPEDYQMGNTCPRCGFEFDRPDEKA